MIKTILLLLIIQTFLLASESDSLKYLGQNPPGLMPEIFAPGLISDNSRYEFGISVTEAGDEIYFAVRLDTNWNAEIRHAELINGRWSKPEVLELDKRFSYNDPFVNPAGDKLYFISNMPGGGSNEIDDIDIWYIEKRDGEWSKPVNPGAGINTAKNEFYVSLSGKKTIYYSSNIHTPPGDEWNYDIYYSDGVNRFRLGDSINSGHFECDPFISKDEDMLIFCSSRPGGFGRGDLYISFRDKNSKWGNAKNLGSIINSDKHEFCPYVSPDGEYFFYTSDGDIYWVSAKILYSIR